MKTLSMIDRGQATIEFIMILVFTVIIAASVVGFMKSYLSGTYGDFPYVLSKYLSTGSCDTECLYKGYYNGEK
jgi:hypothetical protein